MFFLGFSPANKHKLVPDPETAPIVKRMFDMAAQGRNLDSIRRQLRSEEILTPLAYVARQTGKYQTSTTINYPTDWNRNTVYQILKKRVYLGHMVAQRQTTKSFKSKKVVIRPEEEWIEVQHTHAPLVDEKTFAKVQGFIETKRRESVTHPENIFVGMLRCADCNCTLTFYHNRQRNTKVYYCNQYRHSSQRCTAHSITLKTITDTVLHDFRKKAALAREHTDDFEGFLRQITNDQLASGAKSQQRELEQSRKRCTELDGIIKRLFEQNAADMLTDERFMILSGDYETEQRDLKKRIEALETLLRQQKDNAEGLLQFQQIISQYTDGTELNANLLHELVDKIVVYESNGKQKKERRQKVQIHYRFAGVLND